jgi:hypothetical protein
MNIQKYIFPEWKQGVKSSDLSASLTEKYTKVGKSMAEFLDRQMMRDLPDAWFNGWIRYHFPLQTDPREIEIHNIIAVQFSDFINNNNKASEFSISQEDLSRIEGLNEEMKMEKQEFDNWRSEIRKEVNTLREEKYGPSKTERRKKKLSTAAEKTPSQPIMDKSTTSTTEILDREFVYKKWMEEVNTKEISKSYWHIHEYMSRFILDFAEEHSDDGRLTRDLVEDFLVEYGRGKRPKTMNHYNRVARYFWDFYDALEKEEGLK